MPMRLAPDGQDLRHCQKTIFSRYDDVFVCSNCNLANSRAEPQIAAGREPQTMGLTLWSNLTL